MITSDSDVTILANKYIFRFVRYDGNEFIIFDWFQRGNNLEENQVTVVIDKLYSVIAIKLRNGKKINEIPKFVSSKNIEDSFKGRIEEFRNDMEKVHADIYL